MKQRSPIRPGWTLEVLQDEDVHREREYEHYLQYTPGERIAFGEELRRLAYGSEQINARIQRVFEITQR